MMFALMNRKVAVVMVIFVLALAAINNTLIDNNREEVLIIETPAEPRELDPATGYETTGGNIMYNVYETLVGYNGSSTSDLVPLLCTVMPTAGNGLISPDGRNYTFIIRQGVKFHNGDTLTAEDVRYSFERVVRMRQSPSWMIMDRFNPDGVPFDDTYWGRNGYGDLDDNFSVMTANEVDEYNERVDRYNERHAEVIEAGEREAWLPAVRDWTFQFHLDRAYSPFLFVLTHTVASIVNKRTVEAHGGILEGQKSSWMNENMVGTGPWKLDVWEKDRTKLVLVRWDDYWGTKALLEKVIILKVDQQTTRIIDLQMGYTDVAYVATTSLDEVIGKKDIVVDRGRMRLAGYFVCFNCYDSEWTKQSQKDIDAGIDIKKADKESVFKDVRLRQAATYAFDYEAMVDTIYKGLGERYVGPWFHGMYGYNESLPVYEQDKAQARALVEDYKRDHSGSIEVVLYAASGSEITDLLAQQFKSNCEDVGIGVTIQMMSWPILLEKTDRGDFDAVLLGWQADFPHPDGNAPIMIWDYRGTANNAWYNSTKVDAWLSEATTTTNETRRLSLYHRVQSRVRDDCPCLWTIQPNAPAVYRDWVKNYVEAENPFMGRYYAKVYKDK